VWYIWIDTCCIDKSSSAELSEAINSMYRWYEESRVCYAYLEDVEEEYDAAYADPGENIDNDSINTDNDFIQSSLDLNVIKSIRGSRWFSRGWTLQEMIAPSQIIFFGKNWSVLGKKCNKSWEYRKSWNSETNLVKLLSSITTIPEAVLVDPSQRTSCSVARKMSWAARRKTTREEDMAYSLLGIFDVNMPLLYGEGTRTFIRLQEEIMKETDDQSLFAWGFPQRNHSPYLFDDVGAEILAPSPAAFAMSAKIVPFPSAPNRQPYTMTNKGLRIDLRLLEERREYAPVALLDCHYEDDFSGGIGIVLKRTSNTSVYTRLSMGFPRTWSTEETEDAKERTIYVTKHFSRDRRIVKAQDVKCLIRRGSVRNPDIHIRKVLPSSFRSNIETGVVFVALDYNRRREGHGVTLMVEFYNEQFDHHFAVVLSLQRYSIPLVEQQDPGPDVEIISQLEGGPRHISFKDGWENEWKTKREWKFEDTQLVNVSQHPQGTKTMKITAVASHKEILNQRVLVLDVDCDWDERPY
jgi:hypothetical protein